MTDLKSSTLCELGFAIGDKIQFIDDVRPRTIDEVNLHYRPILPFKTISKASETNETYGSLCRRQLNERFDLVQSAIDAENGDLDAAARKLKVGRWVIDLELKRGKL